MREMTLIETGYLAALLVFSLVLPLMMSFRSPNSPVDERACMALVWLGQILLLIAGGVVLLSATAAPYAAMFGILNCLGCAFVLRRRFSRIGIA